MRSRYLWWEAENSGLFWMKYRVGKSYKKGRTFKVGWFCNSVCDSPWDLVSHLERKQSFSTRLPHFCYLPLVNPSLPCVSYFRKFSFLLEEWINNCNDISSSGVVFSIFSSSSDICRNCLYSQRIVRRERMWSSRCLAGEWTGMELVILSSFSKGFASPFLPIACCVPGIPPPTFVYLFYYFHLGH